MGQALLPLVAVTGGDVSEGLARLAELVTGQGPMTTEPSGTDRVAASPFRAGDDGVLRDHRGCENRWALVLAGGDGVRLRELTRQITGKSVPKQYCRIIEDRSLLESTLMRTSAFAPASRTLVIVNRDHLPMARDQLAGVPPGNIIVQPDGTVIVPIANPFETAILAFTSTDGGQSWSRATQIAKVKDHTVAGDLRSGPLPSAAIDGGGKVYVVWQDCRFRRRCPSNDIVMSTSTDGTRWTAPVRIPIDPTNSGADHFIPGLAADASTSGAGARLGLTYYFYPDAGCTFSSRRLSTRPRGDTRSTLE